MKEREKTERWENFFFSFSCQQGNKFSFFFFFFLLSFPFEEKHVSSRETEHEQNKGDCDKTEDKRRRTETAKKEKREGNNGSLMTPLPVRHLHSRRLPNRQPSPAAGLARLLRGRG